MNEVSDRVITNFLNSTDKLEPADAVAAIIVDESEHILLQLRDDFPEIFFPNHWGCFGGAVESGETVEETLIREIKEELELEIFTNQFEYFINVDFNMKRDGPTIKRHFFVVRCKKSVLINTQVNEGQSSKSFTKNEALDLCHVTPYDRLAIWCYFNQSRIV